jgi:ABC-type multidrug transport system fused ATPase/permease subunit
LVACYSYLAMLLVPVVRMTVIGNYYQEASVGLERINAVLDRRPEIADIVDPARFTAIRGEIEFRGVSFAYDGTTNALSDINLIIPAGSTVAFCGKSGAGKTTLVNLLLRFYEPGQGAVLVDGKNIHDVELKSLRSRMAMVLQDDYLFSGTVKENILYGRPGAPVEDLVAAAKAANAHDFIIRLPGGYDADIGEAGVKLSFGQRQRVSIARAVLRNPSILILDEATSGVDSETEREIIEDAYRRTMAGRTTVIIAHRLGIVRSADLIVFLTDGRIAETGSHEELIARKGYYWKMWAEQNREHAHT